MASSPASKERELDELDGDYESDSDPNVFKVRDPLTPPTAKIYSTQQLHAYIHEGTIDLNPSYQRDVVWPETKQIGLIDSIFRNFYIPPVVFAIQRDDDDEEVRICVDGKQRLTSIQKFFDGQIPHRDMKTKKKFWYTTSEASKSVRPEVPEHWKKQFSEKHITCVEYFNLTPEAEREIFQRVQLGMTLTAAEKLQAISSSWADWISDLEARHVAVEGGLSHVLEWDTKRGRDFQCIAHFVYCCDGLPDAEQLPTAQKLEKWMNRVDRPGEQFKIDIEDALREFWNIASSYELSEGFTKIGKRLAPVEFVFVGVLLYTMRRSTTQEKAKAIYNLRKSVRAQFKDIRNNTVVGEAMWGHVNRLRNNPSNSFSHGSSHQAENGKGRKRKKAGLDDSDNEEYRPSPIKKLGKTPKTRSRQQRMS